MKELLTFIKDRSKYDSNGRCSELQEAVVIAKYLLGDKLNAEEETVLWIILYNISSQYPDNTEVLALLRTLKPLD